MIRIPLHVIRYAFLAFILNKCGVCTAICPSAEFYNYDPRIIADTVQRQDEESIEGLLKSDTIWYCGECMSCKTRCPRCNTPGGIIMALRRLSQEKGWFTESEKGRQQFALKRIRLLRHSRYCETGNASGTRSCLGMDL